MKRELELGSLVAGGRFTLPVDLATRTQAIIGIRGSGKTTAATAQAEEFCEAGVPWIALDPTGVWWGLRVNADGSPGGYPVVIIGGDHADIPLEKGSGRQIADAVIAENICCVIDLKGESKTGYRHFVTDFCDRLMELTPRVPRHIFIEEAPEFVPQSPMGEQRRALAAVDRLVRLGRNNGYGATLISQRFATIHKNVLTQCENLMALRCIGKRDRVAAKEWIAEVVQMEDDEEADLRAHTFMASLAKLNDGEAWFWSPQWLKRFDKVQLRRRKTFHAGETRKVGEAAKQVALSRVDDFVRRFSDQLSRRPEAPTKEKKGKKNGDAVLTPVPDMVHTVPLAELKSSQEEAAQLRGQMAGLHQRVGQTEASMAAVRTALEPLYVPLRRVFEELDKAAPAAAVANPALLAEWKERLGSGPSKVIDALVQHGPSTKRQLATLCVFALKNWRFTAHLTRLLENGVIEQIGDKYQLRQL
jgi:hypothetical protein